MSDRGRRIPVLVDENERTPAQIAQRRATHYAAQVLRDNGFIVSVREHSTETREANAASIVIDLDAVLHINPLNAG